MAPKYKVIYFPVRVLAEPIRFILAYGGADFEDIRIEFSEWQKQKSTMPFGTLPVLEVDGKILSQSIPICIYLAKQFGLSGEHEWDNLQMHATADAVNDLRSLIKDYYFEEDKSRKNKLKECLIKETVPFYYTKLDDLVKNNGGYLVGGKLSWVDLYLTAFLELFDFDLGYDTTKNYSNIAALRNKVVNIPSIKAWISKRPITDR